MGNALSQLCARLSRHGTGAQIALVMQVENIGLLVRCIGLAQTAGVLSQLATRIAAELGVAVQVADAAGGVLVMTRTVPDGRDALGLGLRLMRLNGSGWGLPPHIPAPTISAVLVHGDRSMAQSRLFQAGRHHLARHAVPPGELSVIAAGPTGGAMAKEGQEPGSVGLANLSAWFQPQLCCHSGAVTGFELLARLNDRFGGVIAPLSFLPMLSPARQRQVTWGMLTQGLRALGQWDAAGFSVGTVSLNVSAIDLLERDFADCVLWELDRHDIAPSRLVLEVMENLSPLDGPDAVAANLGRLVDCGCQIDLDDFGTGYAGLEALRRLRVNRVKIDRSFVAGCDHDTGQQRLVLAILALAERMGIDALAEGVESSAEHAFVAAMGCSHVQGYAIARPMPLADTALFLAARRDQAAQLPVLRRSA